MTQQERAEQARRVLDEVYPKLADVKDQLQRVLDEAQNEPPEGHADGSMTPLQWQQHRAVLRAVQDLLITHLFRSK